MRRLGISHVPYTLMFDINDGIREPLSVCDNFLSIETELVYARKVFHSQMMRDSDSAFTHFLRCCDSLGIPGVQPAIDKMLALDYIIANEDRHFNNFGFVRNADTLEWVGFAPVFDCGTSLWHNSLDIGGQRKCQPFCQSHEEQLRLVSDLSWLDIDTLKGVDREIKEIYSRSPVIDEARQNAISAEVLKRAEAVALRKRELHAVSFLPVHDVCPHSEYSRVPLETAQTGVPTGAAIFYTANARQTITIGALMS